jgi:hypothetical protein
MRSSPRQEKTLTREKPQALQYLPREPEGSKLQYSSSLANNDVPQSMLPKYASLCDSSGV